MRKPVLRFARSFSPVSEDRRGAHCIACELHVCSLALMPALPPEPMRTYTVPVGEQSRVVLGYPALLQLAQPPEPVPARQRCTATASGDHYIASYARVRGDDS